MTREYCYSCNKCDYEFTIWLDWNKIASHKTKCPMCQSNDTYRNYGSEKVITDDGVCKTLGALADKNSKKNKIK